MQMTALNTLVFADVPADQRTSAATLFAMIQQLALALGVALSAVLLNLDRLARGAPSLAQADFRLAFLACAALAGISAFLCLRLARHAGAEVSGHIAGAKRPAA